MAVSGYSLFVRVFPCEHRDRYSEEMVEAFERGLSGLEAKRRSWSALRFVVAACVDAVAAGLGGTIAHGMLTLSLIVGFCQDFAPALEGSKMVINYGFDKVRFASPVKVNDRIRAVAILAEARERAGQLLVKAKVTIEIEGETKPALIAEWLTIHVIT